MTKEYSGAVQAVEFQNQQLQVAADEMRKGIVGKDSKTVDKASMDVVDTYVMENTWSFVDPLSLEESINTLLENRNNMLRELDTKIKVSNATTMIQF